MKRKRVILFAGLILMFILVGCGAKSQEDVLKDLNSKVESMNGYKLDATMTLTMGTEAQEYKIEVWHNKPENYRVHMKNAEREQSQMILRNKDGVYVLTPALNKSFKFQSDWPKNSSQPYLFESLVQDILEDDEVKFKETDDHYVFETKTRYQYNKMLPIQEITFNKKDLSPVRLQVMDQDRNVKLTVEFSKVEFDAKFDEGSFDLNRNMTSAQMEVPVASNKEEEATDVDFTVKVPTEEIPGTNLVDEEEVATKNGKRVVLTYDGEKSFTLMQEYIAVAETASMAPTPVNGDPVDLGFTIGVLTDHSLTWTDGNVEFMIASNDLTREEMVMLAKSVQSVAIEK
jgi:outer membrane lipoprotein-sorting protein